MQLIRIVGWNKYQHYKNRNPPWIKLHREMLTSRTWVGCTDESRVLAIALMLLAAASDNKIPLDPIYLKRVAYLNKTPNLQPLFDIGFIEVVESNRSASVCVQPLASCASTETETEQSKSPPIVPRSGDVYTPEFETFWAAYPRHTGKGAAFRSWKKLKPSKELQAQIQAQIQRERSTADWQKDNGQFIPHPATWLNQRRFDDDPAEPIGPVRRVLNMRDYL